MNETLTKNYIREMSSPDLARQVTRYIWGGLVAGSMQSDLVEEAVKRLGKSGLCLNRAGYIEILEWASKSYEEAMDTGIVTCRGCGKKFPLLKLFRCFHCYSYFCLACAGKHFGDRDGRMTEDTVYPSGHPSRLVVCMDYDCQSRKECLHAKPHKEIEECRHRCGSEQPCSRCYPVKEEIV